MSIDPHEHYENFPVGSWLVPAGKRPLIHAIYRFARLADDIADEGELDAVQRIALLSNLTDAINKPLSDEIGLDAEAKAVMQSLQQLHVIDDSSPFKPYLLALLDAFIQDCRNSAPATAPPSRMFGNHESLLSYCERSANPIGRMMLLLFDCHKPNLLAYSDAICTGLQWINFMQDVSIDALKGRIYAPSDNMPNDALVLDQTLQAKQLLISGKPLLAQVPIRLSLELRAILAGGISLADKIIAIQGRTQRFRPTLSKSDALRLLWSFIRIK